MTGQMWGVIGGSGLYDFLDDARRQVVETPFGAPAAPVTVGRLGDQRVAFLPRHGEQHEFAAHRVPYRANLWALHHLGVDRLLAACSVGSLRPDIHPGQFVVVDQLVDRTWGRADTFHDVGAPDHVGPLHHQTFAEPYDAALRERVLTACTAAGVDAVNGGTMVVINGPRFSTKAESRWFRAMDWHVVNMTGYPEAVLAAELGISYSSIALVTDYDAGVDGHEPVSMDAVLATLRANIDLVRSVLVRAIVD